MDLVLYQQDREYVLEHFRQGEFDFIDGAGEVFETEFFRYIGAEQIIRKLAESYPSPRKKEEVPVWLYICSNLSMRLHGVHSFNAYPYVVRAGGMLNAFGPEIGHKVKSSNGDVTLSCKGFNDKNEYDRQTPCDQDFLRKFSRATNAEALQGWFNGPVQQIQKEDGVFDPEGTFIGDASYLFVPNRIEFDSQLDC